jgi:hypothetical protein
VLRAIRRFHEKRALGEDKVAFVRHVHWMLERVDIRPEDLDTLERRIRRFLASRGRPRPTP